MEGGLALSDERVKNTGFRIDSSRLAGKLAKAKQEIRAESFKPILLDYARKVLTKCVLTTPARSAQIIRAAQTKQYDNRVNFIPSNHHKSDPMLIIRDGIEFLFVGGKWYKPDSWKLPPNVYGVYQQLKAERMRRLETPRATFIKDRQQARFLYRKSWTQVGASIGLSIKSGGNVQQSLTRRKPAHEPPRGYAQIRGGQKVLNILIFNPFINEDSMYKPFTAQSILEPALAAHRSNFKAQLERHLQRVLYSIMSK